MTRIVIALILCAMAGCCTPCIPTVTPLPAATPMLDSASNDVFIPTYIEEDHP